MDDATLTTDVRLEDGAELADRINREMRRLFAPGSTANDAMLAVLDDLAEQVNMRPENKRHQTHPDALAMYDAIMAAPAHPVTQAMLEMIHEAIESEIAERLSP